MKLESNDYYEYAPDNKCFSEAAQLFTRFNVSGGFCAAPVMDLNEKRPAEALYHVWHIFWTIVPTLFYFAMARVAAQIYPLIARSDSVLRFAIEFVLIAMPTIVSVNVANQLVEYFVVVLTVSLLILVWRMRCIQRARERQFKVGRRPCMLTLARATINFLTVLCILAIDFQSFPKEFRKSRRFGVGLMDVGIGLFVFSMGAVSHKPRKASDLTRLMFVVAPVLFLGVARTVVITAIDYHQDEHEYGVHLNAFFTLGLTKLFGTLLSAVARTDIQLLALGVGTLAVHETLLQFGLSDYVMDQKLERSTFLAANREGLCSLPGFIGIYILSMYIGQWLKAKDMLSYSEFMHKLKSMTLVSAVIWWLVLVSIFCVGIARVTCNFGYAAWILGIAVTMTLLFMVVFDLILNTVWPVEAPQLEAGESLMKASDGDSNKNRELIPTLVEAINRNGLVFFLVANILTGGVNILLAPNNRSSAEGVLILTLYMLMATGFVYILYRFKIRIA